RRAAAFAGGALGAHKARDRRSRSPRVLQQEFYARRMPIIATHGCQPRRPGALVTLALAFMSCRWTTRRGIVSSIANGGGWVDKRKRHAAILELVGDQLVGSQEELRVLLHKRGWDVTQSTLSRDLRELRLARVPTPEGVRYTVADGAISSAARPALDSLLPQLLTRVDGVGELIVVRTVPGRAPPC